MQVRNHTQLINYLIEKYGLTSYCEIGLQTAAQNFDKIRCEIKCSVDPDPKALAIYKCTSDEFFSVNNRKFSLFFIDGYHESDQVERDFNNSMKCLNDGGFIIIHDCLPKEEITTCVPRGNQKVWHGDVYKFAMRICEYDEIDFVTLNTDEGCCIVWKNLFKTVYSTKFTLTGINWETYKHFRREYMHIIEPSELDKHLPKVKEVAR